MQHALVRIFAPDGFLFSPANIPFWASQRLRICAHQLQTYVFMKSRTLHANASVPRQRACENDNHGCSSCQCAEKGQVPPFARCWLQQWLVAAASHMGACRGNVMSGSAGS